jgi:hypothetical protein
MSLTVTAVPPGATSLTLRSAYLTVTVLPPIPRSSTCYEDLGQPRPHQRAMVRRECVHILNRLARRAPPDASPVLPTRAVETMGAGRSGPVSDRRPDWVPATEAAVGQPSPKSSGSLGSGRSYGGHILAVESDW